MYLSLPVADKRAWNKLARDGVDQEDVDNQMAIIAGLTIKAVKGDAKAAKVLFDLLGETGDEYESAQQTREHGALMEAIKKAADDEI